MIDFRYHVVSIIAVFLALALGLFLGGTTLQGPILNDLSNRTTSLESQKNALQSQVDVLNGQLGREQTLDQTLEPYVVAGRLSGQLVTVVSAPGVSGDARSKLIATLERAGATVSADVRLQAAMLDPRQDSFLAGLASRLSVPGRPAPTGTGAERIAAQLASVLTVRPEVRPVSASTLDNVLTTYAAGNLVTTPAVHGSKPRPGTLAILLTGGPPPANVDPTVVEAQRTLLGTLARDLDADSLGAVVAGPILTQAAARNSSGIDLVVTIQGQAGSGVSAVRGVDQSAGRIATVFALVEQVDGKSGSYGLVSGVTPLPTPSP